MKSCFILMPFSKVKVDESTVLEKEDLDCIYEDMLKPIVSAFDLEGVKYFNSVSRFDQRSGSIIDGIISNINSADIVIADLTGLNPNVMYELGVRHSLKRGTIMLSQDLSSIPSDLRDYLCVGYSYSKSTTEHRRNKEAFKVDLHQAISDVIQTSRIDSPVLGYINGKARNWREDKVAELKKNYVVAQYLFDVFDNMCDIVESLKVLDDKESREFASDANAPILYYQLDVFENAIMDLKINMDSPSLYRTYHTAKRQVAAIRTHVAMQDMMLDYMAKVSPENVDVFREGRLKMLKSEFLDYFALERGEFKTIEFQDLFAEESEFETAFLDQLDDYLERSANDLDVSEDEINSHLEIE